MQSRRVRDKFEISLEPKQLALLFVLCLVILILVFALGIIAGRGAKGMPSATDVAQLQQPAAERPPESPPAPPAEPVAEAAPDQAPRLKFFEEGDASPKREASAVPKDAPAVPAGPPPVAKPAPAEAKKTVAKPAAAKKPEVVKAAAKSPDAKPGAAKFTVQVSAFQNQAQADHLVANLKHKGYEAYIAKASIPGKGVWYRVRVGAFPGRSTAQELANTLKRKEGISTYVTLK